VTRLAKGRFATREAWAHDIGQRLAQFEVTFWSESEQAFFPGPNFEDYLIAHAMAEEYMTFHLWMNAVFLAADIELMDEELEMELKGIPSLEGKVAFLAQRVAWLNRDVNELQEAHDSLESLVNDISRRTAGLLPKADISAAAVGRAKLARLADPEE